jgi:hypothetical protein
MKFVVGHGYQGRRKDGHLQTLDTEGHTAGGDWVRFHLRKLLILLLEPSAKSCHCLEWCRVQGTYRHQDPWDFPGKPSPPSVPWDSSHSHAMGGLMG